MLSQTGLVLRLSSLSDWDIFSEIWVSGAYDEPVLRVLDAARIAEPVRIVDLGANVGLFSLRCVELRNQNGRNQPLDIIAVEGVPRVFRILQRNLVARDNDISLSLYHGLIGKRSGIAQIQDNFYAGANAVVRSGGRTRYCPFAAAMLSRVLTSIWRAVLWPGLQIDLLKCDIEGSEFDFLANYPHILARTRILVIEFHPLHCDVAECRRLLAANGLEREAILRATPDVILEMYRNGRGETS